MPTSRPRSRSADSEAAASIERAEQQGVIPRASAGPPLEQLEGNFRERDYRATPTAQAPAKRVPFKLETP